MVITTLTVVGLALIMLFLVMVGAGMKAVFALLVAYAVSGMVHSIREYYRSKQYASEDHRHRWFLCGLNWFPTSIIFPLMSAPFGGSQYIWFKENIKDSLVTWTIFGVVVWGMLWR
jgi:hypothetical protein